MVSSPKLLATLLLTLPLAFHSTAKVRAQDNDNLVRMPVIVANRQGYVRGLTREAFQVTDGKLSRQIEFFDSSDGSTSIGILLDMSKSIDLDDLRRKLSYKPDEDLLSFFIHQSNPNNEYFVIAFDDTPRLVTDWTSAPELLSKTNNITRGTGRRYTALYDACFAAIEKMETAHHSRRVLIVLTDGQDNESKRSFKQVRNKLRDTDILFYGIGVVSEEFPQSSLGMEGQSVLEELADATGGRVFYPMKNKEMVGIFSTINDELRSQYRIGFRPGQLDAAGKWRRLTLKIVPPANAPREFKNLTWRTREGYFTK